MSEPARPVIRLVDDDESLRTALGRVLVLAGYEVRHYASAGDFLLAEPDDAPGCLLLDVQMPGPSGLDLQQALRRRGNLLPVVFLTAHGDIPSTVRAIKAGASDFLCKPIERQTLLAAIETALALGTDAPSSAPRDAPLAALALNARETAVLRGVVQGRLNKQIGADLGLSERTIKTCRADLMRKLGARSLADLVRLSAPWLGP
jgi:FixJ family two-component response regulator